MPASQPTRQTEKQIDKQTYFIIVTNFFLKFSSFELTYEMHSINNSLFSNMKRFCVFCSTRKNDRYF